MIGPHAPKGVGVQPQYEWRISDWNGVIEATDLMYDYLSPRRQAQIDRAQLRPIKGRGPRKVA